ncbi:5'-nucleotidase [Petrocella atlantisensis]|uniref:5'-nucleotidase n=1 Tax=Petrocella atlantisensis TaxID=2173034 RepID=A0A3P7PZL1_9FIRM|nr:HAD-IA family hydrolase [Petrocella atlantisensis]VDN48977.1 5'-nucleotidase [Petrocella atlantisensis]
MLYKYILFDLDGTLTDPKTGITRSVAYALKKTKNIDANLDDLTIFIGPPLKESFMDFYDFTEEEAKEAILYYREYFVDHGIYENEIYEGIEELLEDLQKTNTYVLAVATSKPTKFAELIIKHFGLDEYFTSIVGSNLDGTRTKKSEVIEEVLLRLSIKDKREVVMIGDRQHDILGAKEMVIDSIGVTYGYGTYDELKRAGANYIVNSIQGLKDLVLG